MAKIKFFVNAKKSNPAKILLRFSNGRKFDIVAQSQKQINPDYWNNKNGSIRQRAEFNEANHLQINLNKLQNCIIKEFDNTSNKDKINNEWLNTTIDKFYNPDKYLQNNTTLFGFIQHFINNSDKRVNTDTGNPVCYKMRREYIVTFRYLKEYAEEFKEPDFIDIDLEFYQQFIDLLRKKGLATNTIGKKIQTLKIFLNTAFEQGINKYQKYKSRKFKTISEESDNIYLTKSELKQFYKYDFSNKPYLEKVRDKFIVASWTGLRYSDLQQITPDKINGKFIELKQKKTGKKVVIPVHHTVKEILKKYSGLLPEPISNQKYNDYLKKASKLAGINEVFIKTVSYNGLKHEKKYPKYEIISSHTARRSFCTNAYKDNIPTLAIMSISGHKTEQAFLKYIKADGKEHAEKVLKIWQSTNEFLKIAE